LAALKDRGKTTARAECCWVLVDAAPGCSGPQDGQPVFQPIDSEGPEPRTLPAELRYPKGNWFALTRRGSGDIGQTLTW